MKFSAIRFVLTFAAIAAPLLVPCHLGARSAQADQSFNVTNFGSSAYTVGGSNNPSLTLTRGETVTFNVSAFGHPFYIKTVRTTGTSNAYNDGVTGQGVTSGTLTFVVPIAAPNTLFYQCSVHSPMGGTLNIVDPVGIPGVVPESIWLGPASPNPAREGARFRFAIPFQADVDFMLFDHLGRSVQVLFDTNLPAGTHSVEWDGRDHHGHAVSSGLYFYRLRVAGRSYSGKLALMR